MAGPGEIVESADIAFRTLAIPSIKNLDMNSSWGQFAPGRGNYRQDGIGEMSLEIDTPNFFAIIELMNKRGYLGELELMLLLAVIHLGDEAYGVPISRELEKHRGKNVSLGSVYAALERLEGKGLVVSNLGDPTPERGGKAKRFFRITKLGLRQVQDTRRVLTGLWQTIPDFKFQP